MTPDCRRTPFEKLFVIKLCRSADRKKDILKVVVRLTHPIQTFLYSDGLRPLQGGDGYADGGNAFEHIPSLEGRV
jgi:hypothetical protein